MLEKKDSTKFKNSSKLEDEFPMFAPTNIVALYDLRHCGLWNRAVLTTSWWAGLEPHPWRSQAIDVQGTYK